MNFNEAFVNTHLTRCPFANRLKMPDGEIVIDSDLIKHDKAISFSDWHLGGIIQIYCPAACHCI